MKFSLIFLLAATSVLSVFGQNIPVDFESAGFGATWNWTVFENSANPPLEIVANPDPSGVNTSCTVAKFTALQAGQPFAGCETLHGAGIGSWTVSASNSTIKIMVWKSVISDVGIKLVRFDNWSLGEIKIPNTVTNQWEEIVFDFSAHIGNTYDQMVIFPDFQSRNSDNIIYFDHIYGNAATAVGCGCIASTAAPVPDSTTLSDVNGNCEVTSLVAPTATDSCGQTVTGVSNANLPINTLGTTVVTWTYTDNGGNIATQDQNVVITCATGIEELASTTVSIYPNPSQDLITISISETLGGQIVVSDILGRELIHQNFTSNKTVLSLSKLPSKGTYFAKIVDVDGNVLTVKKFIYQ
jgi:hypothetical protein